MQNEITVNGDEFVKKDSVKLFARDSKDNPFVIIRARSAGVFAGYLESTDGNSCVLLNSRRLWFWSGAASLSQLAVEGVKNPQNCKFAMPVPTIIIYDVIEIINASQVAEKIIKEVPIWKV